MKRLQSKRKLTLARESIKALSAEQSDEAKGGLYQIQATGECMTNGAGGRYSRTCGTCPNVSLQ